MKSRAVGAFLQIGAGRPSQRITAYGSGRVCGAPGCETVLSKYNPADYCSVHAVAGTPGRLSSRLVPLKTA